ncbi:hypothetical protein NKH36_04975 [Mesorhizobium sp. M1312]|uniref:hypothetical protein n=1 Tax=unclassified Mesorhizobium TaxID=325217 RepID=UPI0033376AA3
MILVPGPVATVRPDASTTVSAASVLNPQDGARTESANSSITAMLPDRNQRICLRPLPLPTMPSCSCARDSSMMVVAIKLKLTSVIMFQ